MTTKKIGEPTESEDHIKQEVSELFLLLKSGRLSPQEESQIKARLDTLILELELLHKKHCCGT